MSCQWGVDVVRIPTPPSELIQAASQSGMVFAAAELPEVTIADHTVPCSWPLKGFVTRVLTERLAGREVDLREGADIPPAVAGTFTVGNRTYKHLNLEKVQALYIVCRYQPVP